MVGAVSGVAIVNMAADGQVLAGRLAVRRRRRRDESGPEVDGRAEVGWRVIGRGERVRPADVVLRADVDRSRVSQSSGEAGIAAERGMAPVRGHDFLRRGRQVESARGSVAAEDAAVGGSDLRREEAVGQGAADNDSATVSCVGVSAAESRVGVSVSESYGGISTAVSHSSIAAGQRWAEVLVRKRVSAGVGLLKRLAQDGWLVQEAWLAQEVRTWIGSVVSQSRVLAEVASGDLRLTKLDLQLVERRFVSVRDPVLHRALPNFVALLGSLLLSSRNGGDARDSQEDALRTKSKDDRKQIIIVIIDEIELSFARRFPPQKKDIYLFLTKYFIVTFAAQQSFTKLNHFSRSSSGSFPFDLGISKNAQKSKIRWMLDCEVQKRV